VKIDFVGLIEAAYDESLDLREWLANLVEHARPLLADVTGDSSEVFAHLYNNSADARVVIEDIAPRVHGVDDIARAQASYFERFGPRAEEMRKRVYPRAPTAAYFTELTGERADFSGVANTDLFLFAGGSDAVGIIGASPDGSGCLISATTRTAAPFTRAKRRTLTFVAAHVAAGLRLRKGEPTEPDAVLLPNGKTEHLQPAAEPARAHLEDACRSMERARGKLRRSDPEQAVAIWRGLVNGEWSLVDHIDHDGKRHIVARKNRAETLPWHLLTARERQVLAYLVEGTPQKLVAYTLGLAESTIANIVTRSARKVGARSRIDLIRAYRSFERTTRS